MFEIGILEDENTKFSNNNKITQFMFECSHGIVCCKLFFQNKLLATGSARIREVDAVKPL